MKVIEHKYLLPFVLVTSLFALWGLANNMTDTLLAAFKRIMSMSDTQTSFIQMAFYGAYFCLALPAALFIRKHSYKNGVILGLVLYALGAILFLPAAGVASYAFYLLAIYIMAAGCSVLETTANPYIMSMGSPETATRRLNIAQSFNPIGSILGILVSKHFILQDISLYSVSGTYTAVGVVLLAIMMVMLFVKMPEGKDIAATSSLRATFGRLFNNKKYLGGVIAQFFYVGAQIGVWSFTIRLVMKELDMLEAQAATLYLISIIGFCVSRFVYTWLMKYVTPQRLLVAGSVLSAACALLVVLTAGWVAVVALVLVSVFMSLMFPTIYGIALGSVSQSEHSDDSKIGASGLIMAILGGALITPLQGMVSDAAGINTSYLVPLFCFLVVLAYALSTKKNTNHYSQFTIHNSLITNTPMPNKKVFVSGCYDLLHSGHVEFFRQAAQYGDLYVGIGSDKTYLGYKHRKTVYSEQERLFMVKSIRYVKDAYINAGSGIMDFLPTLDIVKPDILVVNTDGGCEEKQRVCAERGIEYIVLQRNPHEGLAARSSTDLKKTECQLPTRLDLAGTWIDQPYVSQYAPGWAITISLEPTFEIRERCGLSTSTRNVIKKIWPYQLPNMDPETLAKLVFCFENHPERPDDIISGAQDAIGICIPGLCRHYYNNRFWPEKIETCNDESILRFLESHLVMIPMEPRRPGCSVVEGKDITETKVKALAKAADDCWNAIMNKDLTAFAQAYRDSFNAQVSMFPAMIQGSVQSYIDKYKDSVLAWKMPGAGGGGYLACVAEDTEKFCVEHPEAIPLTIRRAGM